MSIKTINIGNIRIYIDRDPEGYISLSTDGYRPGGLDPIIAALRALQTDDDREHDEVTADNAAWVRSGGPRGAR